MYLGGTLSHGQSHTDSSGLVNLNYLPPMLYTA